MENYNDGFFINNPAGNGEGEPSIIGQKINEKLTSISTSFRSLWNKVPTFFRGEQPGGEEFISRFLKLKGMKELYSDGIVRQTPNFQTGLFMEIIERAKDEIKMIFFYLHDHTSKKSH